MKPGPFSWTERQNHDPIYVIPPFLWTERKMTISSIEKAFFKIELRRWDKNMVQVRHEMAQVRYVSGAGEICEWRRCDFFVLICAINYLQITDSQMFIF